MYRRRAGVIEVLLVHPGGPFFARRDAGAWSIPKGHPDGDEHLFEAACREFEEETGLVPAGPFAELTPVRQKGGKIVHAWTFEGDCDPTAIRSNMVTKEWPPGSGRLHEYPEVDRAEFFDLATAATKINPAQGAFLAELLRRLGGSPARRSTDLDT